MSNTTTNNMNTKNMNSLGLEEFKALSLELKAKTDSFQQRVKDLRDIASLIEGGIISCDMVANDKGRAALIIRVGDKAYKVKAYLGNPNVYEVIDRDGISHEYIDYETGDTSPASFWSEILMLAYYLS